MADSTNSALSFISNWLTLFRLIHFSDYTSTTKPVKGAYFELHDSGLINRATTAGNEPLMLVKLPRSRERTTLLRDELDSVWANCCRGDQSPDVAWLFYYYFGQMSPLSNYNSPVAYAVAQGMMLGAGWKVDKRADKWGDFGRPNNLYMGELIWGV